jgi:hypothetical protein
MNKILMRFAIESVNILAILLLLYLMPVDGPVVAKVSISIFVYFCFYVCLITVYLSYYGYDADVMETIFISFLRAIIVGILVYLSSPVFIGFLENAMYVMMLAFVLSLANMTVEREPFDF